jgi:hypothetical protein
MVFNDICRTRWRGRMGVEPTEDTVVPPDGFEVREAHRDLTTPTCRSM